MMGVGKSTIGAMLARRLGRSFVDTDREVEREVGLRIAEIFEQRGEARFREMEREAIDRVADGNAVVALGGGAMAQPGTAARLLAAGTVVYLQASPEQLLRRIGNPDSRPLLAGLDEAQRCRRLGELLDERRAAYEQASVVFDTGPFSLEGAAEALANRLLEEGTSE
jgi:shikimate kinase